MRCNMSIILVRHGETALNAARVLQPPDTPLSARGRLQAQAAARRLASMNLGGIISSDLGRAFETAQAIAAASGLDIGNTALLQERNFGDLRGRAYDELDFDPLAMAHAPPGGESIAAFRARVAQALALLCERRAAMHSSLAVVTHGLVIRTLLEQHLALPHDIALPQRIGNTSLTVFAARAPYETSVVNCTAHLEGELSDDVHALSGV
jgi:broad specificity phosphatase PhoE